MTKLTGRAAIEYAERHGLSLSKYADPTEAARDDLTADEAREVAREDPSLVHLDVPTTGDIVVYQYGQEDASTEYTAEVVSIDGDLLGVVTVDEHSNRSEIHEIQRGDVLRIASTGEKT